MVEAPKSLVPDVLGGNKRTQISKEDVKQALSDIAFWFKENGVSYHAASLEKNEGSSEDAVKSFLAATAESDNAALQALLEKFNGGLWLPNSMKLYSLAEVQAKSGNGRVQLAQSTMQETLCLEAGNLIVLDEAGEKQEDLKIDLGKYLEQVRDKMLTGKFMFDEDEGLMEIA